MLSEGSFIIDSIASRQYYLLASEPELRLCRLVSILQRAANQISPIGADGIVT